MAMLLDDFIAYFKAKGLVTDGGVDAFRDFKPDSPDNVVTLHEYPGDPISNYISEVHRSIQIQVRNTSSDTARQKALSLFNALRTDMREDGRINLTASRFGQIYLRQAPFKISQDDKDRTTYGFNLGITTTTE